MPELRLAYQVYSDWLTIPRAALEYATNETRIHEWIKRSHDPLPARLPPGNSKQLRIYRPEFDEWLLRNCPLVKEKEC